MKHLPALALGVCALLTFASGCETVRTTSAGAVGVDRKQQMLVSSEQIDQGAAEAYEAELKAARDKGALNTDKAMLARVTAVSQRIVAATPAFRADATSWKWQFNLQKTDELNAYCMPGGRIMVYSGLMDKLDLSDAELATVLGHEVAHALREHTRERVSRAYGIRGGPDRPRAHCARGLRPARSAHVVEEDERGRAGRHAQVPEHSPGPPGAHQGHRKEHPARDAALREARGLATVD
jgi:hypothetical protein